MNNDCNYKLDTRQKEAVRHINGPMIVLSGAGAGKSSVLTHRIAHLIEVHNVPPQNILAITFTNKAADVMKQKLSQILQDDQYDKDIRTINQIKAPWISTIHSVCTRILRGNPLWVGLQKDFHILDKSATNKIINRIYRSLYNIEGDIEYLQVSKYSDYISMAKNRMLTPEQLREELQYSDGPIAEDIFIHYQEELKRQNSVDYDDLLIKTEQLFRKNPAILEQYQDRFQYIMVDEYQDVNYIQYLIINQLATRHRNLAVFADEDQILYSWRGADPRIILNFTKDYPEAKVIKLEHNYRSSGNIVRAAAGVIRNNKLRTEKVMYTVNQPGIPVVLIEGSHEYSSANIIIPTIIANGIKDGRSYEDFMILYRISSKSLIIEESLRSNNIPYIVQGGISFYERREIKDVIAYLRFLYDQTDDESLSRIINIPARGIGYKSVEILKREAAKRDCSIWEVIQDNIQDNITSSARKGIQSFIRTIMTLEHLYNQAGSVIEILQGILSLTGYMEFLEKDKSPTGMDRLENIHELLDRVGRYTGDSLEAVPQFLEEIEIAGDSYADKNGVKLMTIHSAKGLESPVVILFGAVDGIMPLMKSGYYMDLEEERRLMYVAMTRAREELYILYYRWPGMGGSIFLYEIPEEYSMQINDLIYTGR